MKSQSKWGVLGGPIDPGSRLLAEEVLKRAKVTMWAAAGPEADFAIRLWTQGAEKTYGWTAEEAMGSNYIDLFVGDDERTQCVEDHMRMVANDEEYVWNFAADDKIRDGQRRNILTNCFPITDPNTGDILLAEIGVDVSELDEANLRLRELQSATGAAYKTTLAAIDIISDGLDRLAESPDAVALVAVIGRAMQRVTSPETACRVWTVRAGQTTLAPGSDGLNGLSPGDESALINMLMGSKSSVVAVTVPHRGGSPVPHHGSLATAVSCSAVAFPIGHERISAVIVLQLPSGFTLQPGRFDSLLAVARHTASCFTMMKAWGAQMEWRRVEAGRIKSDAVQTFLRLVFHGIKGPSGVIAEGLRELESLVDKGKSPPVERLADIVGALTESSDRTLWYLERFRTERDYIHEVQAVDVSSFLFATVNEITRDDRHIEVEVTSEPHLSVRGMKLLIAEALGNLVNNGVRAMKDSEFGGGTLRVSAEAHGQHVHIRVEDQGGSEPLDPAILFTEGHGLKFARDAMELVDGDVIYEGQTADGMGSAFVIRLRSS